MSIFTIECRKPGLFLPKLGLWLDAHRVVDGLVFVSHAHSDHIARHREVILTQATSRLMRLRLRGKRREHVLEFSETREFKSGDVPFRITLLPAGHILGSAMALIESEGDTLLYTGDFKLRPGLAAEQCEPQGADTLVMESTFGRPAYVFPPDEIVWGQIADFCRETVDQCATPILLAYSLGKSQEIMLGLKREGFQFGLHEQAYRVTKTYEGLGVTFPRYEQQSDRPLPGRVLIWPPGASRLRSINQIGPVRTAVITGWALDSSCRYRYGADAAFPIGDHAGYPDLMEMVKRVAPRKVWTTHGFAAEFADRLRQLGVDASALGEPDQLSLSLGV